MQTGCDPDVKQGSNIQNLLPASSETAKCEGGIYIPQDTISKGARVKSWLKSA